MPDIDMDFGDTRRDEVFEYVRRKYGAGHVAQIVTFGTMAARGVIRDVGRVMNIPYADVDVIAKQVPAGPGALHITLMTHCGSPSPSATPMTPILRSGGSSTLPRLWRGCPPRPHPRCRCGHHQESGGRVCATLKNDDTVVCQYVMTTLEELGLLKMDFLGLRNLTVLDDAVKMVQERQPDFSLKDIPEDDRDTFEMISAGKTSGVFQMESTGMTGVCVGLKPQNIEDITAIIALYRPGPMDSIPLYRL